MSTTESQRILKANAIRSLGSKVAYQFGDLEQRGDEYLSKIHAQANEILANAQQQAQVIMKEAHEKGYQEGLQSGSAQAQQQITEQSQALAAENLQNRIQTVIPALATVAATLEQEKGNWVNTWENLVIQLAAKIAEKLTHQQLELQPELPQELINTTLGYVAGSTTLKIRLSRNDYETLGPEREQVIATLTNCAQVQIEADETLQQGDCIVNTQHGTIDARIETQIERIVTELSSGGS